MDGERSRLEEKIESIVAGLAGGAQAIAELRAEREEQPRHRCCEVKAFVDHQQSKVDVDASEALPEPSRGRLRLAVHLARLTNTTKARLELLGAGTSG